MKHLDGDHHKSHDTELFEEARRRLDERLVVDLWPDAGVLLGGRSRTATYRAAKEGTIPVLRIGKLYKVPTAKLRQMLGIDAPPKEAA